MRSTKNKKILILHYSIDSYVIVSGSATSATRGIKVYKYKNGVFVYTTTHDSSTTTKHTNFE